MTDAATTTDDAEVTGQGDGPSRPTPSSPYSTRTLVIVIGACAVLVLVVGLLVGASRSGGRDTSIVEETVVDPPIPVPDLVLTDTDGADFPLREAMAGHLTLLYLGYVNCPDVCPITSAVIDRTLETATADVRDAVQVVFVSVDPERDTPEVIRTYLDGFDPSFIGLRATPEQLLELQTALNAPPATAEPPDDAGGYLVGHASAVYVFDADGIARNRFPFGTRQSDWAELLPRMVEQ